MNYFSRKSGFFVFLVSLTVGFISFFNSNTLTKFLIGTFSTSGLSLILWKSAYYLEEKNWKRLAAILTIILILGAGSLWFVYIEDSGKLCDGSISYGVYENSFTGDTKGMGVSCGGPELPWYWEKSEITPEECYESEKCNASEGLESRIENRRKIKEN